MTTKFIGLKEFRQNLSKLSRQARRKDTCFIVMHHSVPVMRVTPVRDGEGGLEQLAQTVAKARAQWQKGEFYSADEIEKMLAA